MRVSGDSPRHALITQASSASRAISAATTDPDSDPPCPVTGLFPQGNVPGAEPLSSTRPDLSREKPEHHIETLHWDSLIPHRLDCHFAGCDQSADGLSTR